MVEVYITDADAVLCVCMMPLWCRLWCVVEADTQLGRQETKYRGVESYQSPVARVVQPRVLDMRALSATHPAAQFQPVGQQRPLRSGARGRLETKPSA